jgi:membrane-associated protein
MLPVDLNELIRTVGYVGIFLIIFAETGLLVGFFLPGDSLLFTAGFLASQGYFDIWILVPVCFIAAVTGDAVGYAFGKRVGRGLFNREESRFFKPVNLHRSEAFMERHGGLAVIIARFVPFARTFVPIVAGISAMRYPRFLMFNVVGAILWAIGLPVAGYLLGARITHVDKYLVPVVALVIVLALLPTAWHVRNDHGDRIRAWRTRSAAVEEGTGSGE